MELETVASLVPEFLLNSETYSVVITDLEGRYIFVNDLFKDKFAFVSTKFMGQPFSVTVHPDDVEKCNIASYECIMNPSKIVKVQVRKPDSLEGSCFYWTHWEFSLFKDQNGQPIGILCLGHDITETEKASRKAKEFAQKVETIIEEITDGFYVLDRDWRFIKMNKAAEQILGISRTKLLGRKIWDTFPDTTNYSYPAQFRRAVNEYVTVNFEDYWADLDRWFSAVIYPSQEGLTVFFKDITQEKKNQSALEDTANKLKSILDSTLNSYILINTEGKIIDFNQTAQNLSLEYIQKNLVINTDIKDYLILESSKVYDELFEKALKGEKSTIEIKRIIGEQETWFETHYLPVYKEKTNELIGVTLKTVNIDYRKQAELKLKDSETMLRALYDSRSEASTFIDRDLRIVFNNKLAQEITKNVFGKEAIKGDRSLDFIIPELRSEFLAYYKRVLEGESIQVEQEHAGKWWRFSLFPVYDSENNIVGIADNVKDVTGRVQNELKIRRQNESLQKIAWQQSHEVRRPLATILGLCDLLTTDETATAEEQQQYINYISQSAQELDAIIHKIVGYTY